MLVLIAAISIHVLAGVFWAGSSFAMARNGGLGAERLFAPQMGAALIVILSGGYLWKTLHEGAFGPMEKSLGLGVASAVLALAIQTGLAAPALRTLRRVADDRVARRRLLYANRVVAILLAATTIAMAAARYA
jgi:hypothetical protein